MWSILLVTLPTRPNAVRLRLWRSLKAQGCVSLRDGTYLLPQAQAEVLEQVGQEAREHGGQASVFTLLPRSAEQEAEVIALFDRSEAYAGWRESALAFEAAMQGLEETEARRRLRVVQDALATIQHTDHYPGPALDQAQDLLRTLRQTFDARFSRGEPRQQPEHALPRLESSRFQGRRWATRARPWVDRLACAWLVRRFIDPQASFVWLADPTRAPRGAIGFDYDGARFSHVGSKVSFEVLTESFGLDADARLARIAATVHYLDAGGIPTPEAPGLEAVLGGLREMHPEDDTLVQAACQVFDALLAAQGAAA